MKPIEVAVVGTGDFTHPAWAEELRTKLVPAEPGLFRLRSDIEGEVLRRLPAPCRTPVRFLLSTEISTISKRGDRTRKVHHLLFAPDLVTFVLGHSWDSAVVLLQGLAVTAALMQVGFNWFSFYRAHADTRPTGIEALVGAAGFTLLAVPGLVLWGSWGFVVGRVLAVAVQQVVRGRYVRRLLPDAALLPIAVRALRPVVLATVPVLVLRAALWGSTRTAGQAVAELALFLVAYAASALWLERALISEVRRSWRGGGLATLADVEAEVPAPG